MKEVGAILIPGARAGIAAAAAVLVCAAGCLKVTGYEDNKDPIPLRDAWADGEGEDLVTDTEGWDEGDGVPDDFLDAAMDPDTEDGVVMEDIPTEPDGPDEPEPPPDPVWVPVPAGSFEMGCSPGDEDCMTSEEPRHTVNVAAFQMTETEITQAQYEWVTGSNPSYFTGCPDCPVESVEWSEARAFCENLGGRLPSEAEWEYAARADTTARYHCGDDAACLSSVAWYDANAAGTTHPVGEKTANGFGLYDMLGNVLEWTEDCSHVDYVGAPSTGEVWGGGDCSYRMMRGGAYDFDATGLRVSQRLRDPPEYYLGNLGFRCVK